MKESTDGLMKSSHSRSRRGDEMGVTYFTGLYWTMLCSAVLCCALVCVVPTLCRMHSASAAGFLVRSEVVGDTLRAPRTGEEKRDNKEKLK